MNAFCHLLQVADIKEMNEWIDVDWTWSATKTEFLNIGCHGSREVKHRWDQSKKHLL